MHTSENVIDKLSTLILLCYFF
uniref:Uncharacterized protein n=1 Tax=Anguilla anguilla TaxID=7936 RepID=A0A0E9VW73_ANGAN